MRRYLYHVGGKLWSHEPGCGLLVADHPLADYGAGRGLAGAVSGMREFTSIFHIVGPGDRWRQCLEFRRASPQRRFISSPSDNTPMSCHVESCARGPLQVKASSRCSDRETTKVSAPRFCFLISVSSNLPPNVGLELPSNGILNCVF